ncbi:hypothetical protein AT15_02995 [Kosmotoga arenicorallina S304]|uniref:Outer membrane protein beta-barrel domain-containing protein n=1 Tax=Kosmotoga arenicorallina S304 TaxID=1453497 RepID=A0A176K447_9BACT|nr:hypothetical protein [Kosmotoga arenicorallina]OAA31811.1 hypothetical protein AT15_02995 [Kosmotoga arenicorallina S304]
MKKLLLVMMIIGISTLFLANGLFAGIGGTFFGDFSTNPPTLEGAEIYGQVDLSIFTLQLPIGYYDIASDVFDQYSEPDMFLGLNLKLPVWFLYLRGQVTSPLSNIQAYVNGEIGEDQIYLLTKLGIGARIAFFFVEAGMDGATYISDINMFNPFMFPYVMAGVAF